MLVIDFYEIRPLSRDFVLRNWEIKKKKKVIGNFDEKNRITEKIEPVYLLKILSEFRKCY
jgi:hypothetical protein